MIRAVHQKREQQKKGAQNNDNGDADANKFNVQYKVADDPRSALTEADLNSQLVIMHCIRSVYGMDLNIIGEEDDDNDDKDGQGGDDAEGEVDIEPIFEKYGVDKLSKRGIVKDLFSKLDGDADDSMASKATVSLKEVTIYIDPMDGTREFVEERLHNVQCLIGITYKGQPVGGVIGLPFIHFDDSSNKNGATNVVCALNLDDLNIIDMVCFEDKKITRDEKDKHTWQSLEKAEKELDVSTLKVFTGDSKRIHKKHSLEYLEKLTKENDDKLDLCIAGGCGNKILRTTACTSLSGGKANAIAVIPPGTCSWDTAAPCSILFAAIAKFGIKGKATDMFGGELVYDSSGKIVTNDLGAFVSCGEKALEYHEKVCAAMRSDSIILDSLLKKYWSNLGDSASDITVGTDKDEERTRLEMKNAQAKPQDAHLVRNSKGYVMRCQELESMISNERNVNDSKLIGYAMPSESSDIRLFWRKDEGCRKELPDVAEFKKIGSVVKLVLK